MSDHIIMVICVIDFFLQITIAIINWVFIMYQWVFCFIRLEIFSKKLRINVKFFQQDQDCDSNPGLPNSRIYLLFITLHFCVWYLNV